MAYFDQYDENDPQAQGLGIRRTLSPWLSMLGGGMGTIAPSSGEAAPAKTLPDSASSSEALIDELPTSYPSNNRIYLVGHLHYRINRYQQVIDQYCIAVIQPDTAQRGGSAEQTHILCAVDAEALPAFCFFIETLQPYPS